MKLAARPRDRALDALVLALALLAQVEIGIEPRGRPLLVASLAAMVATLPLLGRRRFPFAAPVTASAAVALLAMAVPDAVAGGSAVTLLGLLVASWVAGTHPGPRLAGAAAVLGAAAGVIIARSGGRPDVLETAVLDIDLYTYLAIGAGVAVAAFALHRRAERVVELAGRAAGIERDRAELARAAVAAERRRIARDLHDVIAHNVGVMTVQAGAARLLLERHPDLAGEPLRCVEQAGREALGETRRLFGILAGDGAGSPRAPHPGLGDLDALYRSVRRAGLTVDAVVEGPPRPVPPGVGLAAYRIVQEALTNTLTHAGASRVGIVLGYRPDALEIAVIDDGRDAAPSDGTGHGLVGMRERAALYGGRVVAGPRTAGGYAVRARLPSGQEPP